MRRRILAERGARRYAFAPAGVHQGRFARMSKTSPQKFTFDRRASGLLLHPTSLPGPFGSGDLGPEAHAFVDFLAAAGQRWWQMLPVGPPGEGHSPYSAASAFAGHPALVSLDVLVDDGLLERQDAEAAATVRRAADRPRPRRSRSACGLLRRAFERFRATRAAPTDGVPTVRRRQRVLARRLRAVRGAEGRERQRGRGRSGTQGFASASRAAMAQAKRRARRRDPVPAVRAVRVRPAMAGAAGAVREARHRPDRRHPDLRRVRQRRSVGQPAPVPARPRPAGRRSSPAARRTSSTPTGSGGATRTTTGRPTRRRATAGGSSGSARRSAGSTPCGSTTSSASTACGTIPASSPTAKRGRYVPGPGAGVLRRDCGRSSATCRSSPRTSAASTPEALGAARPLQLPRHARAPVRLRRRRRVPPAAQLPPPVPSPTPARTTTTPPPAGSARSRAAERTPRALAYDGDGAHGTATATRHLVAHPRGAGERRRHGDLPRAGPARPGQREPDERARHRRAQLAWRLPPGKLTPALARRLREMCELYERCERGRPSRSRRARRRCGSVAPQRGQKSGGETQSRGTSTRGCNGEQARQTMSVAAGSGRRLRCRLRNAGGRRRRTQDDASSRIDTASGSPTARRTVRGRLRRRPRVESAIAGGDVAAHSATPTIAPSEPRPRTRRPSSTSPDVRRGWSAAVGSAVSIRVEGVGVQACSAPGATVDDDATSAATPERDRTRRRVSHPCPTAPFTPLRTSDPSRCVHATYRRGGSRQPEIASTSSRSIHSGIATRSSASAG